MCILRALFFAAMMAILTAAQDDVSSNSDKGAGIDPNGGAAKAGSCIDPNGCAQANAGVIIDPNG